MYRSDTLIDLLEALTLDYDHEWPNEDELTTVHRLKMLNRINNMKELLYAKETP